MEITQAFGIALRKLRNEKGLTQEELGFESDLRRTFVSTLELGQKQPTLVTIFKLSNGLNIKPSKFLELVETELEESIKL